MHSQISQTTSVASVQPLGTMHGLSVMTNPMFRMAEEFDFRFFVRFLNRRRNIIAGIAGVVTVLALLVAFMLPPRYRAEAIVMLDVRQTNVANLEAVLSGLPADSAVVRSEIDVISSRAMIGRVIDKLNLLADERYNTRLKSGFFASFGFGGDKLLPEAHDKLDRIAVADELARKLNVSNDGRSYAIVISFVSGDAAEAARIANAFADSYLVDQLETKFEATERANAWLNERLQKLKQQVEAAEKAVADFRRANNLTEVAGTTLTAQQLGEVNSKLVEARATRSQAGARLRGAQEMQKGRGGVEAVADVLTSQLIQKLREQESEVRRQLAELSNRYGDRHPTIINKRAELRDLQSKIGEETQKIIQGLANEVAIAKAKEDALQEELKRLEAQAGAGSLADVTLRQLEREAESNRALYQNYLNRFKQVADQESLQEADARIISRADAPQSPYFPGKILFLLVGLVAGGGLGVCVAFLTEYFDRGFRGAAQIEQATGLAAIGVVPGLKNTTDRAPEDYVLDKPMSSYSEALRSVRTAIHFSNVDAPPKTVMVTSSLPGEGKTALCMSLARSLALAGNKVLLIEADLRRPRIAKAFGVSKEEGDIVQLVAGGKTFEQVVRKDEDSGLHYIVAHGRTPSTQDLLGSRHMAALLKSCAAAYDLVIIDTPPVLAVSDAAMVARHVDTCVFVVRWAKTPRDVAAQAIRQLAGFNVRLAGAVLNQVDLEAHAKYGYGDQGYYYGRYREYYSN